MGQWSAEEVLEAAKDELHLRRQATEILLQLHGERGEVGDGNAAKGYIDGLEYALELLGRSGDEHAGA